MKTTSKLRRAFVLAALFFCVTTSGHSREGGFTFQKNVMIAMSDGTELAANLFLPKEGESFPTILMRTPYQYTPWYLHSDGDAKNPDGSGALKLVKSKAGKVDAFVYDPSDPAPTMGGNNLVATPIGPYDQSEVEQRDDILVYTSESLKQAVEVTGPVKMVLYAATTAKDTDFTAKLVDVHPDGKAYNLCDGIIRARWRNSRSKAELVKPGEIVKYEIDLWVTSNWFKVGHKIRVEISSSNFPRFDRNPNSGDPFGADTEVFKATQSIHHDEKYSSHILLPIIPR
ncbi:MAG: CocE/NonD family hydrolase [Verrucomicrobiales bacterium]|nr:CocE/NonD family hydrolase [Verrucomicrobiales bacterium]